MQTDFTSAVLAVLETAPEQGEDLKTKVEAMLGQALTQMEFDVGVHGLLKNGLIFAIRMGDGWLHGKVRE